MRRRALHAGHGRALWVAVRAHPSPVLDLVCAHAAHPVCVLPRAPASETQ